MFPTFEVAGQAETVGARKARIASKDDATRRASSATSHSSGSSTRNVHTSSAKPAQKSGWSWGSKKNKSKEIQEISTLPSVKKALPEPEPEPEPEPDLGPELEPEPSIAPSSISPSQDWSASLAIRHPDGHRRPPPRSYSDPQFPPGQQQRFAPPLRSLPSHPPSGALPQPPFPGPDLNLRVPINDVDRSRSGSIRAPSVSPSTTSSDRTAFSHSTRSGFSSNSGYTSGYDSVISEESSRVDARYASNLQSMQNLQLEPVERNSSRSESSLSDRNARAQGPFARALAKMENAGARIITARLSEEWDRLDDDESYREVMFEKRLWALTAYQRLTQNKQLQSPAHEILSGSRPADQRRILHLHGSLADGWMLATRYPAATVYTTSSNTSFHTPSSHPAPLNHHSLYVPSLASAMPFPDGYFDAIVSRSVSTVLRNDEWARSFFDCRRVLKPGGQIEILSIDAHLTSEGPRLAAWVDENIVGKLEAHSLSMQPSDTILDTLEIVGLENIRRARVALPASLSALKASARPNADMVDASRMMAFLGRHFYQDLYGKMMQGAQQGEDWFWSRKDIRDECERLQTKMVLTIACAQKPTTSPHGESSYLDI